MSKVSWWTEVSGPRRFIERAADAASAQKSIILSVPADLPFEDEFIGRLKEELQTGFSGHSVEVLDNIEGSPADYFMSRSIKPETRASFRPKPNFTAADFLARTPEATLHGACFIVDPEEAGDMKVWTDFISSYNRSLKKDLRPASFVLLCRNEGVKAARGIGVLKYATFTTHFDTYAYCAIRASEIEEPELIKGYLAELAATITGGNAEQAETAIYIYREFLQDPVKFAEKRFEVVDPVELKRKVWEAQLKCIFPHLESYRCAYIERHKSELLRLMPITSSSGTVYEDILEIELGTLLYLTANGHINADYNEHSKLRKYAFARNDLAHLTPLEYDAIRGLI